jgi:hypothetical protein
MSTSPPQAPDFRDPAVRNYLVVCLGGLGVMLLGLIALGYEAWSLFPVVVGLGTLVLRGRFGPLLVLVALVLLLEAEPFADFVRGFSYLSGSEYGGRQGGLAMLLPDLVLCLGTLAYVAGHYRLQCLVGEVFPRDASQPPPQRKGQRGPAPLRPKPRSSGLATQGELMMLLASLPLWVGLALVAHPWVVPRDPPRGRQDWFGSEVVDMLVNAGLRCRFLVLGTGVAVLLLWGVHRYLSWRRWSATEARLALQDTVWSQTRGEDRRINSWRLWARWRRRRHPAGGDPGGGGRGKP